MKNAPTLKRKDILYPDLSYKVVGILFDIWTNVGIGHKEHFYQRAIADELTRQNLSFQEQLAAKVNYQGKRIGIYYFDFLIENKIILELKVRNYFSKKDIEQLYAYLKASSLQLGIIAHFTNTGVKYKRIVNLF